jgi:transcriptional regulator with XRE-family HTH domain
LLRAPAARDDLDTLDLVAYLMVVAESFGERLTELRRDRMLTQRDLARKAEVSLSTVVNLEKQHTAPRFETIRELARALDVEPHTLFKGED